MENPNPYRNQERFEAEVTRSYHFCQIGQCNPLEQARTALRGVFSELKDTAPYWPLPMDRGTSTEKGEKGLYKGVYSGRKFKVRLSQEPESDFAGTIRVSVSRDAPTGKARVNMRLVARINDSLKKCVTYDDG